MKRSWTVLTACLWLPACVEAPENPVPWGTQELEDDTSPVTDDSGSSKPVRRDASSSKPASKDASTESSNAEEDATSEPVVEPVPEELPPGCEDDRTKLPETLLCTGLFSDVAAKKLANDVEPFAPASPLWSDGAEKHRWIRLPGGQKIDTSDLGEWRFPVGTKAWKEFRVGGKRVETRIFYKVRGDRWLRGAYVWNADETEATFSFGGDISVDGKSYYVPEQGECDDCHEGQADRLLGFTAVSLGLPGAEGISLTSLAEAGLLSDPPKTTELSVGDDGTGLAAEALPLLHINCGVSCHNDGPNATANGTDLALDLDPSLLNGKAPDARWSYQDTALGIAAKGSDFSRFLRIAAGDPGRSLVVRLMGTRSADGKDQMPPIASRVVDKPGIKLLEQWISRL